MSFKLASTYQPTGDQPAAIDKLSSGLDKKLNYQTLLGVTGSGKTFTMANVIARQNRPTLVISHNKTLAAQLASEFKEYFPKNEVHYFVSYYDYYQPEAYIPRTDTYIEKDSAINEEIDRLRHAATQALLTSRDVIIVASVSCIYGLGSPQLYRRYSIELKSGKKYSRNQILSNLIKLQYRRNNLAIARDQFSVRGEIIEVFPSFADKFIYRFHFWGEKLEKISKVDILTQAEIASLPSVLIFPATHYIVPTEFQQQAFLQIKQDMKMQVAYFKKNNKLIEAQRIEERTKHDLEMIEQTGYVKGIENYSRYFDGRKEGEPPYTLLDFFPDDYLLFIDEAHITMPQIRGMYKGDQARKNTLIEYGFRLPGSRDNRPLQISEFNRKVNQAILVSATPSEENIKISKQVVEQLIRPTGLLDPVIELRPIKNQIACLIAEIAERVQKKQRVLVTTLTKRLAEELTDFLREKNIKVQYLHSEIDTLERLEILHDLRSGVFDVVVGINLLREGLDLPEVSLVAILDADKESFLRDERSLMQIMGRAARHSEGKVIMFAEKMTKSMRAAINETNRRRQIQNQYNIKNNITPKSIVKKIRVDRLSGKKEKDNELMPLKLLKKMPKDEIRFIIKEMTDQMELAAQNLEFEKAATLRDQIKMLKNL